MDWQTIRDQMALQREGELHRHGIALDPSTWHGDDFDRATAILDALERRLIHAARHQPAPQTVEERS